MYIIYEHLIGEISHSFRTSEKYCYGTIDESLVRGLHITRGQIRFFTAVIFLS